jgi:hypothetical protein
VRWLQCQHVAYLKLPQSPLEILILPIKRVGHHRPKRDAFLHGMLHELLGYLELGAELRVLLASLEVVCGSVRLEANRPVESLVGKQATHTHHPAVCLADVGQPLPAYVGGLLTPFAVPVLIYDKHTVCARGTTLWVFEH